MAFTTLSDTPLPEVPGVDRLQRDVILKSMNENISKYQDRFPLVNIGTLKEKVLQKVIDAPNPNKPEVNFDPEVQLRGFLKAFENTPAFTSQFDILDDATKKQIQTFKDKPENWRMEDIWKDTKKRGFLLPEANPDISKALVTSSTKHTFGARVRGFFLRTLYSAARPVSLLFLKLQMKDQARRLEDAQAKQYAGGPSIYEFKDEKNTKPMDVYSGLPFENWGKSIANMPQYTFIPTTVLGIQNLVRFAKKNDFRVRCAGYRHSWSTSFSQDRHILISLLPVLQVTMLPDPVSIRPTNHVVPPNELNTIEMLDTTPELPPGKAWCRVGVAVTNEAFRRWAINNKKAKRWTLPVDVILVEVTIGGVNGPICHGAGVNHKTISDYVRRVEYVDANGEHQIVSDPAHLRAAAGCFGLLGIVTHITFELDEISYAVLKPLKVPVAEAIPPLQASDIPLALRTGDFTTITDRKLEDWKGEFAKRATNDYYSEWFWFTYQKKVWVNTWNKTTDPTDLVDYPGPEETFYQWLQGWIGEIINESGFFNALPGAWQTQLMATLGMTVLPPTNGEDETPVYKTLLPDALHFRRGVQNMRVRDMEFQIPIPDLPNSTEADWSVVQRAWWDVIKLVYELADGPPPSALVPHRGVFQNLARIFRRSRKDEQLRTPMRLTLELRIMGGSNLHMAPQAGNRRTASIEVLTVPDAYHDGEWVDFMQRVSDKWMGYVDRNKNVRLNVRPHWAKEWEGLKMGKEGEAEGRLDAREYLRTVSYRTAIVEFKRTLERIGEGQGWSLEDIRKRFSNELWDQMVYS